MSVPRGGRATRRGSSHLPTQPSKLANATASNYNTRAHRGGIKSRADSRPSAQQYKPPRGAAIQEAGSTRARGSGIAPKRATPASQSWRRTENAGHIDYKQRIEEFFQQLRVDREKERARAIRNGLLADPNKRTRLEDAITVVGTCQEMCPEFERIQRIREAAIERPEKATLPSGSKVPSEDLMVKCFHRSDAGKDEQLPSDLRPPKVLEKTLNYLFDDILMGQEPLAGVHKFLWDRTRAIRNDFSIQQVTNVEDLKIAIHCFERIARFHLLSLHQLTHPSRDNGGFVPQQEREQLSNTLVSLMYYYDDSRSKFESPNEAEFRAYAIILEIQARSHDLKARAQSLPQHIVADPRVQTAMRLQAASGKMRNVQNMFSSLTRSFTVARGDYLNFWSIVRSRSTTYLMACAAEVAFNFVRARALETMERAFKSGGSMRPKLEDLNLDDLSEALGFDSGKQTRRFLEDVGLHLKKRSDGDLFLDLDNIGKIPTESILRHEQIGSEKLVESKRKHRAFKAIANGLSVQLSKQEGLLEDESDNESEESLFVSPASSPERDPSPPPATVARDIQPLATSNPFFNPNPAAADPFAAAKARTAQGFFRNPPTSTIFGVTNGSTNSSLTSATLGSSAFKTPPMSNQQINQTVFGAKSSEQQSLALEGDVFRANQYLSKAFDSIPQNSPFATSQASGAVPNLFAVPSNDELAKRQNASESLFNENSTPEPNAQVAKSLIDRIEQPRSSTEPAPQERAATSQKFAPSNPAFQSPFIPQGHKGTSMFGQSPFVQKDDPSLVLSGAGQQSPFSSFGSSIKKPASPLSKEVSSALSAPESDKAGSGFGNFSLSEAREPSMDGTNRKPSTAPTSGPPKVLSAPIFGSSFGSSSQAAPSSPFLRKPDADCQGTVGGFGTLSQNNRDLPGVENDSSTAKSSIFPQESNPSIFQSNTLSTQSSLSKDEPSDMAAHTMLPSVSSSGPFLSSTPTSSTPQLNDGRFTPLVKDQRTERESQQQQAKTKTETIDRLSQELVCGEYGLIEQMTEHLMESIFDECARTVRKERRKERKAEMRKTYLSTKYLALWREKAWKHRLKRKAIQRRQTLAQSVHDLTHAANGARTLNDSSSDRVGLPRQANGSIPLGSLLTAPHHHRSGSTAQDMTKKKRKDLHDGNNNENDNVTEAASKPSPSIFKKPKVSHHKRSQTISSSLPTLSNLAESRGPDRLRASLGEKRKRLSHSDSLMSESMVKRARHLIGKTDTTRTDYFRLKAMGIDPNTPAVPVTHGRSRTSIGSTKTSPTNSSSTGAPTKPSPSPLSSLSQQTQTLLSRSQSLASDTPPTSAPPPAFTSSPKFTEDEESLFAQARALREALAEDETWFRREREAAEERRRAREPRSPPTKETEKERRLRKWEATPSKTSVRLEKTRAGGLLPADWMERQRNGRASQGKGKAKGKEDGFVEGSPSVPGKQRQMPAQQLRGFAALANGTVTNGLRVNGAGAGGCPPPALGLAAKGASMEDAIEL